jgi:hypothetical protein
MIPRRPASFLLSLLALMVLSLTACSTLQSISILPAAGTEVLTAVGQTAQYTAYGTKQMGNAIPTTTNITGNVTWSSSNTSVASISASGVATAVGSGNAQITAVSDGVVATSDITVTIPSSGTGTPGVPSITVTPNTGTDTFIGETAQFEATGSLTGTSGSQNLTTQVQWISTNVQVATVNSSGLTTAVGPGSTTIIAQSGGINGNATLTVSSSGTSATPTLTLIPGSSSASFTGETTQFIALGNLTGSAATQNLTNNVAWISSDVSVATIDQNGLATAVSANTAAETTTITAIGTTSTGSLITANATFSVAATLGTGGLPTLAVYEVGPGTGTVTSSPLPIVCGTPGGTCTGTYTKGTVVTLTEAPGSGSVFGGWSSNCTPVSATTCTITMSNNETVGAIFNP